MAFITIVRHGQASFGAEDYDALSPIGEEQSRALGTYWAERGITFDTVFTGPLRRQIHTTDLVGEGMRAAGMPWPEPAVIDGLAELPIEELAKKYIPIMIAENPKIGDLIMKFQAAEDGDEKEMYFRDAFESVHAHWTSNDFQDDEIESWESFTQRVEASVMQIIEHTGEGKRAVVFSSGGPTALVTRYAVEGSHDQAMNLAWIVKNASFTEFEFAKARLHLHSFNNIPHLTEARLITRR